MKTIFLALLLFGHFTFLAGQNFRLSATTTEDWIWDNWYMQDSTHIYYPAHSGLIQDSYANDPYASIYTLAGIVQNYYLKADSVITEHYYLKESDFSRPMDHYERTVDHRDLSGVLESRRYERYYPNWGVNYKTNYIFNNSGGSPEGISVTTKDNRSQEDFQSSQQINLTSENGRLTFSDISYWIEDNNGDYAWTEPYYRQYKYLPDGRIDSVISDGFYYLDNPSIIWFIYNTDGTLQSYNVSAEDGSDSKTDYIYNAEGNIAEIEYHQYYSSVGEIISKDVFTYDVSGNTTERLTLKYNDATGDFVNTDRSLITYNEYDLPVMTESFDWEDEIWVSQIRIRNYYESYDPTDTIIPVKSTASVQINPNPAYYFAEVSFMAEAADAVKISLYDAAGKMLMHKNTVSAPGKNTVLLNFEHLYLRQGMYYITIVTGQNMQTAKFEKY